MKLGYLPPFALLIGLAACGPQRQPQEPARNESAPTLPAPSAPPAVANDSVEAQPEAQGKATVDPKSTAAAVDLVTKFAGLLNQRKFDEAYMLLGPNAPPRSRFDSTWSNVQQLKVEVGEPGGQEGAAGSIYVTVPLKVSGYREGEPLIGPPPNVIVRRVNDVPGSTEAQRRWHIERIDWGSGG